MTDACERFALLRAVSEQLRAAQDVCACQAALTALQAAVTEACDAATGILEQPPALALAAEIEARRPGAADAAKALLDLLQSDCLRCGGDTPFAQ